MYRILELNPQLAPYAGDIDLRMFLYRATKNRILGENIATLNEFANAHNYYGFHPADGGWYYREWAPSAYQLYLTGDFNGWNQTSHPLRNIGNGNWEIFLPGEDALWDGCKVKTIVDANLTRTEHIPLYARRVVQDKQTITWCAEVVDERKAFDWTDKDFKGEDSLYIYEAHVGMAQEEGRIGTYREFADITLPHVKKAGYNTIQLMAIMEHPYYGSFGYQVANFFAASSWFGRPEDLKYLVNKAHEMGIRVLLDVVHSHAVKNTAEGINMFDGTVWQFFHDGEKGDHPAWGTKCFNYASTGVLHFLLSNLKFWMTEYHFDGFRFDGITSMLYHDHGLGVAFDNDKYFSYNTHTEAIAYLQLANELIREVNPKAVTIAEDMSGMPGMCLPIADGGIGFDYRLGMGLPDMWIRTVKEQSDEQWDIGKMWGEMCLRRPGEGTVAYVESHDQALVGDKTMIFRLADAAMYTDMEKSTHNPVIDRAIALHKMIRMFTLAGGGEAYLNFMGNEFGHPEWIDFPREGNGWSFHYCRRQWSLKNNDLLKYQWLNDFDEDMVHLTKAHRIFDQRMGDHRLSLPDAKVLVFYRNGLLFAFNFHPTQSMTDVVVPVPNRADYTVAMSSDDARYGGQDLVAHMTYPVLDTDEGSVIKLYLPARTVVVLEEGKLKAKRGPRRKVEKTEADAVEKKPTTRKKTAKAEGEAVEKKPTTRKKAAKADVPAEEKPKTARKPRKKAEKPAETE